MLGNGKVKIDNTQFFSNNLIDKNNDSKIIKNNTDVKKTYGRPNKNKVYIDNRQDVLNKISKILNFDGVYGIIILDDITKEQQEAILSHVDDIKLYFNYAKWSFFKKDDNVKTYLMLIKSLFKNMGYEVRQFSSSKKENNVVKKINKLSIIKNKSENI